MKKIILLIALIVATAHDVVGKSLVTANNLIDFNFDNVDLTEIIQILAAKEDKNIIFPQGANSIKQKISIHLPHKITLEKAWEYASMLLNVSGFTMIPHNGLQMIIKNDPNSNRETLPIYVGFNPQDFPVTENKIRAIVYLTNLKVPEKSDANATDPINMILNDVLSAQKSLTFDTKTNAIIVADSANKLSTALNIIMVLDRSGEPNVVEVVEVYNIDPGVIVDLLKTQILALTGDQKGNLKADVKSEAGLYFGANPIHMVADNRINSIILAGASPNVERVKDLIAELDQPTESGRSILHIYELQYLDAILFAPVLQKIVKSGTETAQATKDASGSRKSFEGVIVVAEEKIEEKAEALQTTSDQKSLLQGSTVFKGGNRLIITARQQDWQRIKALIKSLDIPQPIIIVEVMVIDVIIDETKILGAQVRNLTNKIPTTIQSNGITAQAPLLNAPILNTAGASAPTTLVPEPAKLASDLLSLIFPGATAGAPAYSIAQSLSAASPGSLIMSFNDPNGTGIWGVLQVLDSFSTLKVLSHPFLVARNNREAETIISTIRRDQGQAFAGQAAVVSQKIEDIEARLRVGIIPRVSSLDRVNMQIAIDVQEFTSSTNVNNFTRNTRTVNTNSNISSGQILALGGLGTLTETESTYKVPILSEIPIIGPFFQYSNRLTEQANLLILITPTIIEPKIRGGVDIYTRDKISTGFEVFETESVIGNPRDPVTRWFFKSKLGDAQESANVFLSQGRGDFVREFQNVPRQKRDNTRPRRSRRNGKTKQAAQKQSAKNRSTDKQYVTETKFGL